MKKIDPTSKEIFESFISKKGKENLKIETLLLVFKTYCESIENQNGFKVSFEVEGKKEEINILEKPEFLFVQILQELAKIENGPNESFKEFIEIQNKLLESKEVNISTKIDMLFLIEKLTPNSNNHYLKISDEKEIDTYSSKRLNVFFKAVNSENISSNVVANLGIEHLKKKYFDFLDLVVEFNLSFLKFENVIEIYVREIKKRNANILDGLFISLIRVNDLFTIITKEEIYGLFKGFENDIPEEKRAFLETRLWHYPIFVESIKKDVFFNNIDSTSFTVNEDLINEKLFLGLNTVVRKVNITKKIEENNIEKSVFDFVIPIKLDIEKEGLSVGYENVNVQLHELAHFKLHPAYEDLKSFYIGGATFEHLFDMNPKKPKDYTFVRCVVDGNFHPSFDYVYEKNEISGINDKNFDDENAFSTSVYNPTKKELIRVLRSVIKSRKLIPETEMHKINIDLFSYFRQIFLIDKKVFHTRHVIFSSRKLFEKANNSYFNKVNMLYSRSINIQDILKNEIFDEESFQNFIYELLLKIVKHNIQYEGGYQYFWNDKKCEADPKSETRFQNYIHNVLNSLCTSKGIEISMESVAANGRIDYLFSMTLKTGKLVRICVELKKAHHYKVATAVDSQLPIYMKSKDTNFGIYLVIWFKNKVFKEPKKHDSVDSLSKEIESNIDSKNNIKSLIIDVNKPISPSKL